MKSLPIEEVRTSSLRFGAGLWRLADPKISLASASSLFLGACAAARLGSFDLAGFALAALGIFFIEVGKNASGEIFDFETDSAVSPEDRSPFSGGKRVLVDGLLTRAQAWLIARVGFGVGIAIGLYLAAVRDDRLLWIGLAGVGCAWFYNAMPVRLAYRGWGEAAVGLCYGPLIFWGTLITQRVQVSGPLMCASIPLGLLIVSFLWLCEFPDVRADLAAGKLTLVARLGRRRASYAYLLLNVVAAAVTVAVPWAGAPSGIRLGLVFLIPAFFAGLRTVRFAESSRHIVRAQALALVSFLAYSAGAGFGLLALR